MLRSLPKSYKEDNCNNCTGISFNYRNYIWFSCIFIYNTKFINAKDFVGRNKNWQMLKLLIRRLITSIDILWAILFIYVHVQTHAICNWSWIQIHFYMFFCFCLNYLCQLFRILKFRTWDPALHLAIGSCLFFLPEFWLYYLQLDPCFSWLDSYFIFCSVKCW